jgi:hypothetical protein
VLAAQEQNVFLLRPSYNWGLRNPQIPAEPLAFIEACIAAGRVRWTYHVTMRLEERRLVATDLPDPAQWDDGGRFRRVAK